jgi:predicted methyltransferase
MRTCIAVGIALLSLSCDSGPPPRDASNAVLPTTTSYRVENTNAVREITPTPFVLQVLAAPDRTEEDRALDDRKQAADLLTFLHVMQGMRVAELASGAGYMTELLARSVGPGGAVFAQNSPALLAKAGIADPWAARLARPANVKVTRVDRDLASPLPEDVRGLDLVFLAHYYRDLRRLGVDRDAMVHAVQLSLRKGGHFVVLDRAPVEGNRAVDLQDLHNAESRNVRREIEGAGFTLESEGRFLRTANDPRDWNAATTDSPPAEPEDRFVLSFVKP